MFDRRWIFGVLLCFVLAGCEGFLRDKLEQSIPTFDVPDTLGDVPITDPTRGLGLGEACTQIDEDLSDCRLGLDCVEGECAATATSTEGTPCILTDECADGLHCGLVGVCQPSGEGRPGQACTTAGECERGLYCEIVGFAGVCAESGEGDVDDPCEGRSDCLAGLRCGDAGTCQPGSVALGFTPFTGQACESVEDDDGPARVFFEIPRGDVTEFFRLPYPNDVRMSNGTVDLDGFPTPGVGLVGFDPVQRIVEAAEEIQRGASTLPTVFVRFSRGMDFGSLRGSDDEEQGLSATMRYVNIDPDSPGYGSGLSYSWHVTDGGGKYICPRYVAAQIPSHAPLEPETTYAFLLLEGVETADGEPFEADEDFRAVLADAEPDAATTRAAWEAYAPLRSYLDDQDDLAPDDVLGGAVFTTQPVHDTPRLIREAIQAPAVPRPEEWTVCEGDATSPCDDGLAGEEHVRGCFGESAAFHEIHMRVPLPVIQRGEPPYLRPEDGGGIVVEGGAVRLQGRDEVCVSLTIPKGLDMPEEGWPVAIYGHGTGGTFRSAVRDVGEPLARIDVGEETAGFAVVGWDGPMHGERRRSELDPEVLFFNVGNPVAAAGNVYQGVADVFELVRVFEELEVPGADSPTGEALRFDASRMAYIGHSQGSQNGPLAVPYEPRLTLAVWSGAGAGLVHGILNKTEPVDAKLGAAVALQEFTNQGAAPIDRKHPALNLVQGLFDPVDPLNHAVLQFLRPLDGMEPNHALQTYGLDDSFSPPATIELFARRLGVEIVHDGTPPQPIGGSSGQDPPVSLNRADETVTGALLQAVPDGFDGHFVLFRDAGLREQFRQFMGTWIVDGAPTVVSRP